MRTKTEKIITGAIALTLLGYMSLGTMERSRLDQEIAFSTVNLEENIEMFQAESILAALRNRFSGYGSRVSSRAGIV